LKEFSSREENGRELQDCGEGMRSGPVIGASLLRSGCPKPSWRERERYFGALIVKH